MSDVKKFLAEVTCGSSSRLAEFQVTSNYVTVLRRGGKVLDRNARQLLIAARTREQLGHLPGMTIADWKVPTETLAPLLEGME